MAANKPTEYGSGEYAAALKAARHKDTTNAELVSILEQAAANIASAGGGGPVVDGWAKVLTVARRRVLTLMKAETSRSVGYNFVKDKVIHE